MKVRVSPNVWCQELCLPSHTGLRTCRSPFYSFISEMCYCEQQGRPRRQAKEGNLMWTLLLKNSWSRAYAAVNVYHPPVRGRREFDVESWGAKYIFTVDFLANPLKLCAGINLLNTWVTDCFHFCRIPVELLSSARRIQNIGLRSPPQMRNARITSYSWCAGVLLEVDSHVGL
jgi:hypothetical protein